MTIYNDKESPSREKRVVWTDLEIEQILLLNEGISSSLHLIRFDVTRHVDVQLAKSISQFIDEQMNFAQSFDVHVVQLCPASFGISGSELLVTLVIEPRLTPQINTVEHLHRTVVSPCRR